jgi:hypothetical protein
MGTCVSGRFLSVPSCVCRSLGLGAGPTRVETTAIQRWELEAPEMAAEGELPSRVAAQVRAVVLEIRVLRGGALPGKERAATES